MTYEESELIIKEQDKSTKEILKVIEKEKCELLGIIQGKDKAIQELEKEIAVLKKKNIKDCKNFNRAVEKIGEQLNQKHYQLTKAKEIIKKFLDNAEPYSIDNDVLVEAEQFIKAVEK